MASLTAMASLTESCSPLVLTASWSEIRNGRTLTDWCCTTKLCTQTAPVCPPYRTGLDNGGLSHVNTAEPDDYPDGMPVSLPFLRRSQGLVTLLGGYYADDERRRVRRIMVNRVGSSLTVRPFFGALLGVQVAIEAREVAARKVDA